MSHPSFPLFPHDLLVGAALMTDEQFGVYVKLLCFQWCHGSIPDDHESLTKLITGDSIPKIVRAKFKICDDGKLRNQRMEMERTKLKLPQSVQPIPKVLALDPNDLTSFCQREAIPVSLRCDGFPAAWYNWKSYRLERNEPLTSYTSREMLLRCERIGPRRAVAMIRASIANSWKNLFEERDLKSFAPTNGKPHTDPATRKKSDLEQSIDNARNQLGVQRGEHDTRILVNFLKTLNPDAIPAYFTDPDDLAEIQSLLK